MVNPLYWMMLSEINSILGQASCSTEYLSIRTDTRRRIALTELASTYSFHPMDDKQWSHLLPHCQSTQLPLDCIKCCHELPPAPTQAADPFSFHSTSSATARAPAHAAISFEQHDPAVSDSPHKIADVVNLFFRFLERACREPHASDDRITLFWEAIGADRVCYRDIQQESHIDHIGAYKELAANCHLLNGLPIDVHSFSADEEES
jgi:hypothetical protein